MKKHDIFSAFACIINSKFKTLFLLLFSVAGFGQALLPVYNTDTTIEQAGWFYGTAVDALGGNYDCAGAGANVIRFNGTSANEFTYLNYATTATNVSFSIQRNNPNDKTLLVEQSVDGITYTIVATVTNTQIAINGTTYTLNYALNAASRYVRFRMTVRDGGAYFLDAIAIYNTTAPACGCTSFPTSNDGSGITSTTVGSATFAVADVTYYNYVDSIPNLTAGTSITSSITFATGWTYDSHIWIDFNDDGVFNNTTERVYSGVSLATNPTTLNTTFPLPGGATPGQHKMRIGTADNGQATPTPCYSGTYGVTIELFVNIISSVACTTPLAPPTALVLTPAATSVAGSFTASASANGYLVIRTTTAAAPTNPTIGTAYTAGTTALGGTIVQSSNATTFTDSPLASSTQYWYWVFAYNTGCTGQPAYLTTSPLTNNSTTLSAPLIVPTTGNNAFSLCSGNLYDNGGSAGNYAYNSNGYTVLNPTGVGNYIEISGSITAEAGYDFLTIYDGVGTGGAVLWGGSPHGSGAACSTFTVPTITSITGSLTVRFYSDGLNNCSGFNLAITCTTTPGTVVYCEPTSWDPDGLYIDRLGFIGTLLDPPANTSTFSGTGYQNFTSLTPLAVQAQGEGVNVIAHAIGNVLSRGTWKAWVDWNKDGVFNNTNELVYNIYGFAGSSVTFGFAIPVATPIGDYRMRIRVNNGIGWGETYGFDFNACDPFTSTWAEDNYGETEDYLFTVIASCPAYIATVTDGETCGTGTVDLEATGVTGVTGFSIYATETGGTALLPPPSFSSPGGVPTANWTTPSITTTTTYWIEATNGSCTSVVRTPIEAKVSPTPTVLFTPASPVICGEGIIQITAGGDTEVVHLVNEKFEAVGTLGAFTNVNIDATPPAVKANTSWKNKTSVYLPATNPDSNVWYPAVSSGFGPNKFAITNSDSPDPNYPENPVENSLALTTAVDATGFLNLTLELDFYFSRYYPSGVYPTEEFAVIEISTDDGANYNAISPTFTSNVGIGTRFTSLSYNLNTYINQNLKIRVRHYASASGTGWVPGGVAVDNIELFGDKPLSTSFEYDTATVDAFTDPSAVSPYEYVPGTPASTIWIRPTLTQLENATFTIPVTTILSNGCTANGSINVINNTKIFKGPSVTDWNNPSYWSPSLTVPDANSCVIIPNTFTSIIDGSTDGNARNLTVKDGGELFIQPNGTLTVVDAVTIEPTGLFYIKSSGSLIQLNNVSNTVDGDFYIERAPGNGAAVANLNYVYWSSPVSGFAVNNISPNSTRKYAWNPTIPTNGIGHFGNWIDATGNSMAPAKGYIVRGLSGVTADPRETLSANSALFRGSPNNGLIEIPIYHGNYNDPSNPGYQFPVGSTTAYNNDDNWNLIGNPYPSAISADAFIDANAGIIDDDGVSPLIGAVWVWPHGGVPSPANPDPFYYDFGSNYADQYIKHNKTGTSPPGPPDMYLASGQAFFVLAEHAADPNGAAMVEFNNTMRNFDYDNSNFYRTINNEDTSNTSATVERHRIWLDMVDSSSLANTILIGYVEGATNGNDSKYDAPEFEGFKFYSTIENEKYAIQGRALPFVDSDQVPLGFNIASAGNYTIAINSVDGLFETNTQDIYLEDTYNGIIHDLRIAPYSFNTIEGTFDDRFILRYNNSTLSMEDFNDIKDINISAPKNNYIQITSTKDAIKDIAVYDMLGRVIFDNKNILKSEVIINELNNASRTLVVKVTLANGLQKTQKVVLK